MYNDKFAPAPLAFDVKIPAGRSDAPVFPKLAIVVPDDAVDIGRSHLCRYIVEGEAIERIVRRHASCF